MSEEPSAREELSVSRETIDAQIRMRLAGRRKRVMHGKTLCSRCYINPPQAFHKYCKLCKNADAKARRARNKAALESMAIQAKVGG